MNEVIISKLGLTRLDGSLGSEHAVYQWDEYLIISTVGSSCPLVTVMDCSTLTTVDVAIEFILHVENKIIKLALEDVFKRA